MIITTAQGMKFDTSKPASSSLMMVLNDKGQPVLDTLRLTGKVETVTQFMQPISMIEVESSFGVTDICEEFLYQ